MKITKKRVPWNKGKKLMPLSKEHKKNISIALLSFWKLHPDFVRNLKSVHKGLTYEEEYGKQKANMIKEKIKKNHWSKTMVSPRKGLKLEKQVGKQKSEKIKKKMSISATNRYVNKENHPCWKGGKSFEPYGLEFDEKLREKIRKRDQYRCQQCFRNQNELHYKNGKKYKLNVHHIDFDKMNNDSKNLISLCHNCHSQTNYGREEWTSYFQNRILEEAQ